MPITDSSAVAAGPTTPAPQPSSSVSASPSASASTSATPLAASGDLAKTGFYDDPRRMFSVLFVVIGFMFVYTVRIDLLTALYTDQPWLRYDKNYNLKRAIWSTKYPFKS